VKAAVLGHPIAHSLSPVLHNAAYAALGLADWEYQAIDVTAEQLPEFLRSTMLQSAEWAGFSLTMPLKKQVIPWLKDVAGAGFAVTIDPLAAATGAANTLVRSVEEPPVGGVSNPRHLSAYNTDVYGIVAALREVIRHGPVESIAILGAGATAASALAAAQQLGAEEITVFARPGKSMAELTEGIARINQQKTIIIPMETAALPAAQLGDFEAVISTLPAHATDALAAELAQTGTSIGLGVLLDVVYDPRPTDLLATWSALGGAIVGGERMLLHQAAQQVELMIGQPAPLAEMAAALTQALD